MNWFKKQLERFADWLTKDSVDESYIGEHFWEGLKIQSVNPKKGETIIVKLDVPSYSKDYERSMFLKRTTKIIQDSFPDNNVIGMYDSLSLRCLSDENLAAIGLKRIRT